LAGNQTGGNTEPVEEIESPTQNTESLKIQLAIKEQEALILKLDEKVDPMIKEWEPVFKEKVNSTANVWIPLNPTTVKSEGGAKFGKLPDGSYLAGGKNPANDVYTITSNVSKGSFSAILLECFPDPSLPNQSLGRFSNGNFVLSKIEAELSSPSLKTPLKISFNKAIADYSQKGWDITNVVGNDS